MEFAFGLQGAQTLAPQVLASPLALLAQVVCPMHTCLARASSAVCRRPGEVARHATYDAQGETNTVGALTPQVGDSAL